MSDQNRKRDSNLERIDSEDVGLNRTTNSDERIKTRNTKQKVINRFEKAAEGAFEDTVLARCEFSKLKVIYITRAFVSICLIVMGLTIYEYWNPYSTEDYPTSSVIIHILMILVGLLAVGLYILQLRVYERYLRATRALQSDSNVFQYIGVLKIVVYSIMLFCQPFIGLSEQRISGAYEGYFDGSREVFFVRGFNEYLLLVQFTTHYFTIVYLVTLLSDWAGPTIDRICRMNGCENNFLFVLRALLVEMPNFISVSLNIVMLMYFSVAIRITENGYLRELQIGGDVTKEIIDAEFVNRGIFWTYKNTIWNMFITMSTIGYGEINVLGTFSRVLLFFVSLSGLIVTSILVVAYGNFFELDNMQTSAFKFFNALELKIRMRNEISRAINSFVKMYYASKRQRYGVYKKSRIEMEKRLDNYKIMSNFYQSLYGANDIDSIKISVIKADDCIDEMMKYVYANNPEVADHVKNLPEGVKEKIGFLFKSNLNRSGSIVRE